MANPKTVFVQVIMSHVNKHGFVDESAIKETMKRNHPSEYKDLDDKANEQGWSGHFKSAQRSQRVKTSDVSPSTKQLTLGVDFDLPAFVYVPSRKHRTHISKLANKLNLLMENIEYREAAIAHDLRNTRFARQLYRAWSSLTKSEQDNIANG